MKMRDLMTLPRLSRCLMIGAVLLVPNGAAAGLITPDALSGLPKSDVVLLGEVHDNPEHHANQVIALSALKPKAVVFEMLTRQQAVAATPTARISAAALGAALGWEAAGWPDFNLYFPIFIATPDAVVYGGAVEDEDIRQTVGKGAAAVFGPSAAQYGLTEALPADILAAREADMADAHCGALPPDLLGGMVEVQRLRDAALARAIMQAYADTGGPVAVIAGAGHARRDWGIPAVLALSAPMLTVTSVGQLEAPPETPLVGDQPYDLWLVTPPAPRPDPCLGLAAE